MKIPHAVLLIACGLLLSLRSAQGADMVAIAGDEINMRSGPGSDQPVLWKLGAGFPLEVVSSKGEWQQVKDFEGSRLTCAVNPRPAPKWWPRPITG